MKQPAARLLSVASSRAPWLLPAVGIALFVHKQFICYQSQGTAAANAKARSRSRPPKLRRAVKKAQLHKDVTLVNEDCAASAEQERLDAMGLGSDKLMEWFTEDEVEALQQAQANPSAHIHLMSGSRFRLDEQYDESDDDWYTDHTYDSYGYDSQDPEYNNYLDTLDNFANSNPDDSAQGGFEIMPLSGLTNALSNSDGSAASSPTVPGQQQQQWQAAQQLLQQLTDLVQQQQQSAPAADSELHSNADSADYFNHQEYYALSPAANRRSRASLDILQGNYLPRSGALWASSYPPHMDDLESDEDLNLNEYLDREHQQDHGYLDRGYSGATPAYDHTGSASAEQAVGGNQVGAGDRAGAAAAAADGFNPAPQQQQQQRHGRSSARWLAEFEPPMPDFEPDLDFDPDYGYDFDYDYEPDYVPGFDDALGFDQLDAAFATVAAAAAAPV